MVLVSVFVMMLVTMFVLVRVMVVFVAMLVMMMLVLMTVAVPVLIFVVVLVMMAVFIVLDVDIEFCSGNATALLARNVDVISPHLQLLQRMLQAVSIDAQVNHRANEHVAADTAKNIKIKAVHVTSVHQRRAR
jgi:hypothetical protein